MFLNRENWEDGRKYYEQTYVKLKSDKVDLGERIWLITSITPSELHAEDVNGETCFAKLDKGITLDYVLPRKTVYQLGDNAAILMRVPARMWHKGLHRKNTNITVLSASGSWLNYEFSIKTIEGFVNKPSYYTFEEAQNNFNNGNSLESAALTPRLSITRLGGVFVDQVLVGKYSAPSGLALKKEYAPFITPHIPAKVKFL